MADEFTRNKLYEYGANSNLVLEADRDSRARREDEGKGEVETLNGRLDSVRMGDRLAASAVKKRDKESKGDSDLAIENPTKKKKQGAASAVADSSKNVFFSSNKSATSILSQTEDLELLSYRPKTRETKSAYEELLRLTQMIIGDQPQDILKGAADEILSILKDDSLKDFVKQKEITKISSKMTNDLFYKIVTIGKRITDYRIKGAADEKQDQDESGKPSSAYVDEEMAVVFDDEDDAEEEQDEEVMLDADGAENEEGVEANAKGQLKGKADMNDNDGDYDDRYKLSIHDIDAHWLQRQLSKFYSDANVSSKLAEDTLSTLQIADERICENKLVVLLDFDKFEFIKLLMKNRAMIFYCTKLRQAQTDQERAAVEEEIKTGHPELLLLIQQKASAESWTQDRIGEFANKARREARALNKEGGKDQGGLVKGSGRGDDADNNDSNIDGSDRLLQKFYSEEQNPLFSSGVVGAGMLNLDDYVFNDGGHFMANSRCELPEKSWRAQKKGYEEVHVPALRPKIASNEKLVQVSDLPDWVQPAFSTLNVRSLNRVQSKMLQAALYESHNLLLCAPTGAGKTNVALMCMLHEIGKHRRSDGTFDLDAFKIVYVAPMKALVQECVLSFSKRLAPYGISVKELSGDQNLTRQQIQQTQVIITTPEKWDIVTRKAGDRTYTQIVRLMIIDEIHLLHDERGAVLESLIARTIRQIESSQEMVRMVGLSATLPNYEDVATFLRVEHDKGLFFFDNSYRPVPLQQQYIGITEKKALKRFQLMNEICYEKVLQQAGKNQVLIFTHSRAETAKTAIALRDMATSNDTLSRFVREDSASLEILKVEAATAKNPDLKDLLPFGFAIHHAGMVRSDRTLVEDLFADKHIQVLVSTATLAWGVNLPCHTVIIKGTQMYSPDQGRWVELSPLDIMQMMGRAGRYGLDSEGEGIILTAHSELQYYLSLMNQQLPIESQFVKKLPDMLNAEVVLGSLSSVREAASWLGYTYLYVRMLRNPTIYGVSKDSLKDDPTLLRRRLDLIHSAASLLDKHNLIKYDRKSGTFQETTLGRVASHYYVSHESINVFNENLKASMGEIEIFRLFSLSGEFRQVHVREEEKLELAKLVSRVPIPVKEGVEEPSSKVNVLLQAYISRLKLEGFALVADMTYIQQSACRLMRALFEVALKRGWAALSLKLLGICKMVEKRTWGSQSPLRQFGSIPEVIIRKLEKNSDITWDRYYDLKPSDLGEIVKIPKMGKTLYRFVHMFPKLLLNAHILPVTRSLLKIDLSITPDFEFDSSVHESSMLFWIIVEDVDGEKILHQEPFTLNSSRMTQSSEQKSSAAIVNDETIVNFTVPIQDPLPPQYFIKVVSDRWLHSEATLPVSFRHLILPLKFPPPTELLDLQPLPVSAFHNQNPAHERLFRHFKYFNPIQTQTFSSLYESDENTLICAPTGSGKTVCAELAILRLFASNSAAKCVYVAPKKEIADATFDMWIDRLGDTLGKNIVMLTGDITIDLNLLESGDVIISSAVHWDMLSRRWKQRKAIHGVALYIFDELHLVGGEEGPTVEIVVSRARFIASQLEKSVRMIALATSLANARDVGDWIGASPHSIYNFTPDVRPVPLDIHIQSFDTNHFSTRILSMAKPTYTAITKLSANKPAIVFVPSRKQAQLTAIDLIAFATSSGSPLKFLHAEAGAGEDFDAIKDAAVAQTAEQGVGFIHTGLSASDRQTVERMFAVGRIQILVVPHNMCWTITAAANLVVVMDTVFYEGREHRYVDYAITDILQMIGKASRHNPNHEGCKCLVMCHSPKKEYLRRLLHDPLPIESHIDHYLHDHLNAEVVTKTIENKPDAVDYLTWTFYYRRLTQNPNYYNLQGTSHRHISDHLSELIETTINDLEESKCLAVEEDIELSPLNLGMISSYYYIKYTTIELFAASVAAKTKVKGVIEILSSSSEFSHLTIRQGEDQQLRKLSLHIPNPLPASAGKNGAVEDPAMKALILLQTHFSRISISGELVFDLNLVLLEAIKLLQALVDVISSQGWLKPALAVMEVSQMVVQGQWDKDPLLLQVPHFNADIVERLKNHEPAVETVFDLLELEDSARDGLLQLPPEKMSDVAMFCNAYPNIELTYEMDADEGGVPAGETVVLKVLLSRDIGEEEDVTEEVLADLGKVVCPRYPRASVVGGQAAEGKREGWWLVVGDPNNNSLLSIKRIALVRDTKVKLEFTAPETPGDYNLVLYLMSDSYLGSDQEFEFSISVIPSDEDN